MGASAGGLTALVTVLASLPDPFPVAIALVLHLSPDHRSYLPEVLSRGAGRQVVWAKDGSPMRAGAIYAAPPGRHVVIDDHGETLLTTSRRVHFSRPSVDRLFTSAARTFGRRVIAVVLTGTGIDGAAGALVVRRAGGVVIAQDEASSEYFSMARETIESGAATFVLPLGAIAAVVARLVADGVAPNVGLGHDELQAI